MTDEITLKQVKAFAASMAKRCDVTIVTWEQLSWFAKWIFKRIGRRFDSGIPGLPFEKRPMCLRVFGRYFVILKCAPGALCKSWMAQVQTITHECGHKFDVEEFIDQRGGTIWSWVAGYVKNQHFRCWAEGGPNTAEAEVRYYLTGRYATPVCDFNAYLVTDETAMRLFRSGCETRRQAVLDMGDDWTATQKAARIAIEVLTEMGAGKGR